MRLATTTAVRRIFAGFFLWPMLWLAPVAWAISPEHIEAPLAELLQQRHPDDRTSIELAPLPQFVSQAQCTDLAVFPRTERLVGSVPIQLRCTQPVAWSAYINVHFGVWREVLTACHSLSRNQTLTEGDLCPRQQSLTRLRQHALFDMQEAVGMAMKRALTAGAVLYRSQLAPAITINRGERLTIEAKRGQVLIQTTGKALASGSNGQQIQVQNLRSGRKLAGWILGPGRVSTTPFQIREKTEISAKVLMESVDRPPKNPAIAAE